MSNTEVVNNETIEKPSERNFSELREIIKLQLELKELTTKHANLKLKLETQQSEIISERKRFKNSKSKYKICLFLLFVILLAVTYGIHQLTIELEIEKMKNSQLETKVWNLNDEKDSLEEKYENLEEKYETLEVKYETLLSDVLMKGRENESKEYKYDLCVSACQTLSGFFKVAIGWIPGTKYITD